MKGLQGHINHISCAEHMSLESLVQDGLVDFHIYESCMPSESDHPFQTPSFLPMLLKAEQNQQPDPAEPGSFQLLLRLQEDRLHQQQQPLLRSSGESHWAAEIDAYPRYSRPLENKSCVTYASKVLSESRDNLNDHRQQHFPSCKREPSAATVTPPVSRAESTREMMRKTKRSRPSARNMEEVEQQRMTHIAVERNRRKLMNDHLCSLRSLVAPSFIQRGDQASIIGGAIEYVKELEQLLHSLQAKKRMRAQYASSGCSSVSTASDASAFRDFFTSPQYTTYTSPPPSSMQPSSSASSSSSFCGMRADEEVAEGVCGGHSDGPLAGLTTVADVEATVVHTHVNLKVLSPRRPGQLLLAIAALEDLHLTVLHLNITTFGGTALYSLNLRIEEECKLGSADEIATAVHQILSLINSAK